MQKRKRCLSLSLSVEDSQSIAGVVWLRDLNAAVMELCSVAPRCHISGARGQAGRHGGGGGRLVGSRSSLLDTYRRLGSRAGLSHTETRSALTHAGRTGSLASVFVRRQRWQQPLWMDLSSEQHVEQFDPPVSPTSHLSAAFSPLFILTSVLQKDPLHPPY